MAIASASVKLETNRLISYDDDGLLFMDDNGGKSDRRPYRPFGTNFCDPFVCTAIINRMNPDRKDNNNNKTIAVI
ncbi:hypothetical protein DERF_008902 [Dermatophagoides farinae]|uniref:Uncharacterized protein n=1 Tax=Dermatophagoides farinae TaxID=6954 RepID=A0A922I473_DERFA|nr:hypothetical protein DERF_008902 [Dermatophagoides farinae]